MKSSATDSTSPLCDQAGCVATAMRKASRRLAQMYDEVLAPTGLRSTQLAILAQIDRHGDQPPTMQDLAVALVMDRSTLGHNLRPLERDGLVELQPGVDDRRRRHVVLSKTGRVKLRQCRKRWEQAQARFYECFGEARAERLRDTLLAIAHDERLASMVER